MDRLTPTRTAAERVLDQHGIDGYERPDGRLRVLSIYTQDGEPGAAWETIERAELLPWLGY